jgi:hypothetical protein
VSAQKQANIIAQKSTADVNAPKHAKVNARKTLMRGMLKQAKVNAHKKLLSR